VQRLESQVAEASRSDDVKLLRAQNECESLRDSLLSARKRILGLNTALANVAETIGLSLGLQPQETEDFEAHKETESSKEADAQSRESVANHFSEDLVGKYAETPGIDVQLELITNLDSSAALVEPLARAAPARCSPRPQQPHVPNASLQQVSTAETRTHPGYHDMQPTAVTFPELVDTSLVAQQTVGSHLTSFFDTRALSPGTASLYTSRPVFDVAVGSPPGNAHFPSVFAGHLAACEYFIKQSKAYRERHNIGGSEM
jgi:hypothetical protein